MGHAIFMWLKNKQSHALTPAQLGDRAFIDMYLLGILWPGGFALPGFFLAESRYYSSCESRNGPGI